MINAAFENFKPSISASDTLLVTKIATIAYNTACTPNTNNPATTTAPSKTV